MAAEMAANAIRRIMSSLKEPGPHDKVYKNECQYTFDTPESAGGLYVHVATRCAVSEQFLATERKKSNGVFYIHQVWTRVPKAEEAIAQVGAAPVKLAIGLPGGFASDAPVFDTVKTYSLVVFTGPTEDLTSRFTVPFPSVEAEHALPTYACNIAKTLMNHEDNSVVEAAAAWAGEDKPRPSKYAAELKQLPVEGRRISPNPADWVCGVDGCGKRDNLWLNLGTGFIGCGRKNWDGTGGNGHALAHFQQTGGSFPVCVKLGTITPAGGDCYSYAGDEDDAVEDPHLAKHLGHWGINIMNLTKTEKSMAELEINLNAQYDFSRISESGRDLIAVTGPGKIGLDNLGNTCYINSSVQLLATVPELAGVPGPSGPVGGFADGRVSSVLFDTAPAPSSSGSGPHDDLLAQTAKLFSGLGSERYAASKTALSALSAGGSGKQGAVEAVEASVTDSNAMVLSEAGVSSADASTLTHTHGIAAPTPVVNGSAGAPSSGNGNGAASAGGAKPIPPGPGNKCGFLVPRMYRSLVGRGHADFSSSRQQDAPQFLEWLLGLYDRAYGGLKTGGSRANALAAAGLAGVFPPNPSDLLSFTVESRLACAQSGRVRYSNAAERFLRLRVPLEAAINRAEVDAARRNAEATAAAAETTGAAPAGKKARLTGPGGAPLPRYHVPFNACLRAWANPSIVEDWLSPATGTRGAAVTTQKVSTMPKYLMVVLSRYELAPDWTTRKIDAEVPVPLEFDLSAVAPPAVAGGVTPVLASAWDPAPGQAISIVAPRPGGVQPGEELLPTDAPAGAPAAAAAPAPVQPDAELVVMLESMGFPSGACARAAVACNNAGMEQAMEWLLSHNDDPDFDAPYVPAAAAAPAAAAGAGAAGGADGAAEPDAGAVSMLGDMGFGPKSAAAALKACSNDLERAADWLFSRVGSAELEAIEAGVSSSAAGGAGASGGDSSMQLDSPGSGIAAYSDPDSSTAKGKYVLLGFLSHMGSSPASGHYVAHVRRDDAGRSPAHADVDAASLKWHIFNDSKVALSEDPPLEQGYVYLFKRVE